MYDNNNNNDDDDDNMYKEVRRWKSVKRDDRKEEQHELQLNLDIRQKKIHSMIPIYMKHLFGKKRKILLAMMKKPKDAKRNRNIPFRRLLRSDNVEWIGKNTWKRWIELRQKNQK